MTDYELSAEWDHIYETRLGILCGTENPTQSQISIAMREADEAVDKLTTTN